MPFSMPSYFLGVGTVVGALTLGFGGGILLTKTAIKDTSSGPSRIERAARTEPLPAAPQITEARAVPVPRADPPPAPQVQAAVAPVQTAPEPSKPVAATQDEPAKAAEPAKAEPVRQAEAPKQAEPRESGQWASPRELRRADREQRRMERRAERERYYAERRARGMEVVRLRQRPLEEEREQPRRPELAFEREEPKPNLFEGLFGRPQDAAPAERE